MIGSEGYNLGGSVRQVAGRTTTTDASTQTQNPEMIYATDLGCMYWGDTARLLEGPVGIDLQNQVQLVFTSPPFPLNARKKYGNLRGEEYIEWFASFAPLLANVLKPDGSIVVEIGNAWEP